VGPLDTARWASFSGPPPPPTAGVRAMAVPTESTATPAAQRINQDT
jgi:hypothetical protein